MAGGLASEAGDTIAIARASGGGSTGSELVVNVKRMLAPNASEADNPPILPHDAVQVAKHGVVYVMGAVERPGGFPIEDQERITLLQAVSLASGLKEFANPRDASIIRESDGVKIEIPVRLDDVIDGQAEDLALEPRDVLLIPESGGKRALSRGVEAVLQMATGLVIWRRR
jgi:polysaccharide export outer membrane protein